MSDELLGKVAIITGGASGIGREMVDLFLEEGAQVVAADINATAGEAMADELGEDFAFVRTDVTKDGDLESLVAATVDRFERLDVMVNNAGAVGEPSGLLDLDADGFSRTMDLLARSVLLGHKHAGRQMKKQGTGGSIVSLSSIASIRGGFAAPSYDAAKAAVLQVARTATFELAEFGIRSNIVMPGMTRTPIMARGTALDPSRYDDFVEALREPFAEFHPLGRGGDPRDIANAALFFASDRSSFITGQSLTVDGGLTSVFTHDLGGVVGKAFAIMGVTDVDPSFGSAARG
ncbi:SDR family NAD(P)-dependent oxidoreductase [Amnibacterium flavum]|uniref:3-oxoacyl-ACP reductase n=1 Tax=Amnibacterium flavum TaxID=2173173 RepID=A0A2V1HRR0_9MICO|nr:glucose 1-dehydrogenase [Amnibacterium flavum]PVZ95238.1 3-oxoacyl-ACP reductase [Amnibacterium flavum]